MEELPVAMLVAQAEKLEVRAAQVQAWMEASPVVLEDHRRACVCLVMLVLQWTCGCATGSVWRRTTR